MNTPHVDDPTPEALLAVTEEVARHQTNPAGELLAHLRAAHEQADRVTLGQCALHDLETDEGWAAYRRYNYVRVRLAELIRLLEGE